LIFLLLLIVVIVVIVIFICLCLLSFAVYVNNNNNNDIRQKKKVIQKEKPLTKILLGSKVNRIEQRQKDVGTLEIAMDH
jgi:uncharacterized membrane protein YqiK